MTPIYFEQDVDPELIRNKRVLVVGYGSQGHAHAQNLKDSGIDVRVGLYEGSKSWAKAEADGLCVVLVEDGTNWADVLMFCTPDQSMADVYAEKVKANLRKGQTLLFAHGFNIHYGLIVVPDEVAVAMVSPKGPGQRLREEFLRGAGLPGLIAVHQDPNDEARSLAMSYAWGIGCARAGLIDTTFREETETDLFGEQAVLCGGMSALIKAGFETLVEAGYQPEAAYLETLHETKLIVDLLYRGGLRYMRSAISDTAEWGDYIAGDRVINDQSKAAMREILADIQSGEFARRWVEENRQGRPTMEQIRAHERDLLIEKVGADLRRRIPVIEEVES